MRSKIAPFFTALFLFIFLFGSSQSLEDILDNHFQAIGQDKLLEVNTYFIKASVKQLGINSTMYMKMKRPNKFRMETEIKGQKIVNTFNGEEGWMVIPGIKKPRPLKGEQLLQAKDQSNIDGELYNYSEKGVKGQLIGTTDIDGIPMFHLEFTDKSGGVKNYYIDSKSYLIKKITGRVNAEKKKIKIEQYLKEYKDFDGILIATVIESKTPFGLGTVTIEEVKFNEDFEESIFDKP